MLRSFRQSFKRNGKIASTLRPIQISAPIEIAKKNLILDNVVFIKSETVENELLESFFNQLIASIREKKESKERDEVRYRGLGYIAFISYVFFNSVLKAEINLTDDRNKKLSFKLDITKVNFSPSSLITKDCIDKFVAGEEKEGRQLFPCSIFNQYPKESFSEEVPIPNSIDWATFRIEINEVIFRMSELSDKDIDTMFQIAMSGENKKFNEGEKEEIAEIREIIITQRDKLRAAALSSETYSLYRASHPITEQTLKQRYRQSQFFECGLSKKLPVIRTVEMSMEKEGLNNNSAVYTART